MILTETEGCYFVLEDAERYPLEKLKENYSFDYCRFIAYCKRHVWEADWRFRVLYSLSTVGTDPKMFALVIDILQHTEICQ